MWGLTTHGKYSASGDEPHYLVVARSLYADRDLDVANNYAANDGRLIGHDGLEAGPHARPARDGRLLSAHDPGVPMILAPVYGVASRAAAAVPEPTLLRFRMSPGLFTYSLISLFVLACTAASVAVLINGLSSIVDPRLAATLGAIVVLSPPVLSHSFLVFPEAIAFAVACAVVWWILTPAPSEPATWAVIAALGFLPWCHRKYSLFVIAVAIAMVWARRAWWRRRTNGQIGVALAVFAIPHALFYLWTYSTWGNLGGPQMIDGVPLTVSGALRGFAGLWLDRQYGLFAYAPVYLLLPACWAIAGAGASWTLLPVAALAIPMGAYADWTGGFSPAARYLVPIIPFCAVAMALAARRRAVRWTVAALLVPQAAILAYGWQHPRTLWPTGGLNPLLERLGSLGRMYEHALPTLRAGSLTQAAIAAALILVLNAALVAWARAQRPNTPSSAIDQKYFGSVPS